MNRIIAGLAIAGAIVSAAPAHADPDTQYIADLAAAGVPQDTLSSELRAGYAICQAIGNGSLTAAGAVQRIVAAGITTTPMASTIVGLAIVDLCPVFVPGTARRVPSVPVPSTIA